MKAIWNTAEIQDLFLSDTLLHIVLHSALEDQYFIKSAWQSFSNSIKEIKPKQEVLKQLVYRCT